MPTKEELEAENVRLRDDLARVQAELDERPAVPQPNTRPQPKEPKFGISEGQRSELEMTGKTVSPFTGARQVGSGEPGDVPKVVSQEEFDKIKDTRQN